MKRIVGHEDYAVTTCGKIISFKRKTPKILKQYVNKKSGYCYIEIDGEQHLVHRLIAITLIPNLENKPQVNHIDENKQNNSISNLEWVTASENNLHGTKMKRSITSRGTKLNKKIKQLNLDGTIVKIWDSMIQAEQDGFDNGHISKCCKGQRKTHKGFKWEYADFE